jgi:alpha-methylacyl-CoA racemase
VSEPADASGLGGLLTGLRVIDLTRNLPGPFATRMLADLGAEIIKVEPPEGDPARSLPTLYEALNAGKATRTVDFKHASGLSELRSWLADADVMLDSFRPGAVAGLGLSFDQIQVLNPRLVMVSITGYGQSGPWAGKAGHDLNFMAMSGVLDQLRAPTGELALSNVQWGDLAAGSSMACIAVLAAVLSARQTGQGRHIDVSMTHGLHAHLVMPKATGVLMSPILGHWPGAGQDMLNGALPCYNLYATQDGRHLAMAALEYKFWRVACEGFERPAWADRHWQRGLMPNSPDSDALRAEVAALVASAPLPHWVERFEGLDACVTPVLTLAEAQAHPLFVEEPGQARAWHQISV